VKVIGLDGRAHVWSLADYYNRPSTNPSSNHTRCRELLLQIWPSEVILEEVGLPGLNLRLDFYLPRQRMAIEVHGESHYGYITHFHKHRIGYANSLQRDNRKKDWCNLNHITLVELPHNEDLEKWKIRIIQRPT
jgi:hypothetical protein